MKSYWLWVEPAVVDGYGTGDSNSTGFTSTTAWIPDDGFIKDLKDFQYKDSKTEQKDRGAIMITKSYATDEQVAAFENAGFSVIVVADGFLPSGYTYQVLD